MLNWHSGSRKLVFPIVSISQSADVNTVVVGVGEDTEMGETAAEWIHKLYEDVIDWQSQRCTSSIPRRFACADKEETLLARRLEKALLRRNKALAGGDVCPSRARLTKVEAELINSIPGVIPVDQKEPEDQKIVCEESDRDDEKSKKSRGPQRPAEGGQEAADVDEKSRKRLEAADGQRGV